MILRPRLALLAALLTPAVFVFGDRPWLTLIGVFAAVAAIAGLDAFLAVKPTQIGFARRVPGSLSLDKPATLSWTLRNNDTRAVEVAFAEALAPSLQADVRRAALTLGPGQTATIETDAAPTRRGRFGLGEVVIRTRGPLGFAGRQHTRWLPADIRVLPRFPSRAEAELRIRRSKLDMGIRAARLRGGGSEFEQLRDFTIDDEFRKIDWSATARAGRTIVRTYRAERNQTVINILDNGRTMAGQVAGFPRVEYAMDAIMAVTTLATNLGDRAGLLAFDRTVRASVPASARRNQLGLVTSAMFDLEPALAESDYRQAFTETLVRFSRRTMLIVHTELVEQSVGQFLLPALPLLTRSHVVVVAAVRDPEVSLWADTSPADLAETHRHAAARRSLDERARTTALLRRAGATVIDAEPGALASQLMDHYLEVKATGRL